MADRPRPAEKNRARGVFDRVPDILPGHTAGGPIGEVCPRPTRRGWPDALPGNHKP